MSEVRRGPLVEMPPCHLYEDRLPAGDMARYFARLAERFFEFEPFEIDRPLVIGEDIHHLLQRGELGPQVEVMNETVLLVTDIDEGGIQPGHDLLDLAHVNVAHRIARTGLLLGQLDQLFVFEQRNGYFTGSYIDY